jgi:arylsulfatase A-like enzyme
MIRTDDWKLVRHYFTNGLDELYDLNEDPGETRNLYDQPRLAPIRYQLQKRLTAWQRSISDPILSRAGKGNPVP